MSDDQTKKEAALETLAGFKTLAGVTPFNPGVRRNECGDCIFYHGNIGDFKSGTCYGNPPGIMFTQKGPVAVRPAVAPGDLACRHFKKE